MASPAPAANGAPSPAPQAASQSTVAPTASTPAPASTNNTAAAPPSQSYSAPQQAATSLTDSGSSPRPRDARTIHMVLASLGVHAYQERVPLQLLDFAYRYTSAVLSDAQHLQSEGYLESSARGSGGKRAAAGEKEELSLNAVRAATASRLGYQFSSSLPKETLLEIAAERNRVRLPEVGNLDEVGVRGFGVRLPHERFVLSGADWGLLEEWDSDAADEEADDETKNAEPAKRTNDGDARMADDGDEGDEEEDADKEGFEAVFGEDDGDKEMGDD